MNLNCVYVHLSFVSKAVLVFNVLSLLQVKQSRALIESIVKENKVRSENKERQLLTPLLGKPWLLIEIVNLYLCPGGLRYHHWLWQVCSHRH